MKFYPIKRGPDLVEAVAFFRHNLDPRDYDTTIEFYRTGPYEHKRKSKRLDIFLQEWVLLGKGDVNGDGVDERFYYFDNVMFCGSAGCQLWIVEARDGKATILCDASADDKHVWITDRVTVNGHRELQAVGTYHWRGSECQTDESELDSEAPPHDALRE